MVAGNLLSRIRGIEDAVGVGGNGRRFFCDPANGSDSNNGLSPEFAFDTLQAAHDACTAGRNDVVYLVGDGSTTGTARQSIKLSWTKNATHLIGITAPAYQQRARIAPTTAITAFTPLVEVTASGCIFQNFSLFHGFTTGTTAQICWRDTGSRNYYEDVSFGGMGDTESAADTGSRSLLLEGAESVFRRCVIGIDTITRHALNASVEFKTTSCKRNTFDECFFPFFGDAATPVAILVATAAHSDRWQRFKNCTFFNAIGSTSTAMTGVAKLAASIGGLILFENCHRVGITDWGYDATSLAQCYVAGPAVGATDDVGRGAVAIAT